MKKHSLVYYYIFLIFYLEIANKLFVFNKTYDLNLIYIFFNTLTVALLLNFISHLFREKTNKMITFSLSFLLIFYYGFQIIFYNLFNMYFSFSTINLINQAIDFSSIVILIVLQNTFMILVILLPFIFILIMSQKFNFKKYSTANDIINIISIFVAYCVSIMILFPYQNKIYSAYNLYFNTNALESSVDKLGLATTTRLDIKRAIFGFDEELVKTNTPKKENKVDELLEYENNELDIDFASLIAKSSTPEEQEILNYLKDTIVTKKNKYTGYFKGKNLIFILAEGFNEIAVSEQLTPTLYKLTNNGFVFENYYSPLFLSTTGGEFQASTGLIPTQETLKIWKDEVPNIYYALGNQFTKLGYTVNSYHNWSYKYYKRHKTMPTLGYNNYLACGNGLEKEINCKWLPSDIDMINVTFPKYSDSAKFMTNYISVSGHAPYSISSANSIALKNKDLVKNLNYSNNIKAYLATQIEFDRALKNLIELLDKKGILDDTVLVITGDHYPYSISLDEINQLSSYKRDEIIEVNHSNLVIWNSKMEKPIKIDKVASQIDVLPTILNLFDIPYDSRLIVGHDILSNTPGLAIFSNRSWVSDNGSYYVLEKKFVPKKNKDVSQSYIDQINSQVANDFAISNQIIKYNMYNKILGGN